MSAPYQRVVRFAKDDPMVEILIDHGYVVYETHDGNVEVLMPLPKREPQTFVLQQQLNIPTGPLDSIVVEAGSVVNVDEEGVVTIMSGHQFDKKKFPGIGSLSPEAKAEKYKWAWQNLDKLHKEGGIKPGELAVSVVGPKKSAIGLMGFVNKLMSPLKGEKNPCGEIALEPPQVDLISKAHQEQIDYLKTQVAAAFSIPPHFILPKDPLPMKIGLAKVGTSGYTLLEKTYDEMKALAQKIDTPTIKYQAHDEVVMEVSPMPVTFLDFNGNTVPPAPKETEVAKKATTKKKPVAKAEGVFGWVFESSTEVQGTKAKYSTVLRTDHSITCNCPGWIFKKKGETVRACKHTRNVEEEAKAIFKKWKKGEPLPTVEDTVSLGDIPGVHKKGTATKIGYSRTLDE